MSWQPCPVCKGSGLRLDGTSFNVNEQCSVCKGERIINEFTGRPPKAPDITPNEALLKQSERSKKEYEPLTKKDVKDWFAKFKSKC